MELHQRAELEIAAFDEAEAKVKATEMLLRQHPGAHVASVAVGQIAECEFHAGSRVNHRVFGSGEVLVVTRSEDVGRVGFRSRVKFDDGKMRNLRVPNPHLRLERPD